MRLKLDGVSSVAGSMILNIGGEQCNVLLTGTYIVHPNGVGSMQLTWSSATGDPDGDAACSGINGISQSTGFVIETGGAEFDFESLDDFLAQPGVTATDPSDLTDPFVGTCKKQ